MRPDVVDWNSTRLHVAKEAVPRRGIDRAAWRWVLLLVLGQAAGAVGVLVLVAVFPLAGSLIERGRYELATLTGVRLHPQVMVGVCSMLMSALVVLVIAAPFIHVSLSRWRTGMRQLHKAIAALGTGVEPRPLTMTGGNEVDHLLSGFNDMAGRLLASHRSLAEANASLEERVAERTRQWKLAAKRAEEANEAKTRFLATMTHEIRTPLNGVIGSLELLNQQGELSTEQQQLLRTGYLAGKALLNLVNDVLDFSKIGSGELALACQVFMLEDVAEEAIAIAGPLAVHKGVDLTCYIDPGVARAFRGDPARLRQIFLNLLNNAVRFTDEGSIELAIFSEPDESSRIRVEVSDTGIGIPENALSRLFSEFQQAGNDDTHTRGGTGLGLAIAKHFVNLMGGEIGVRSKVGAGSTFWFTANLDEVGGADSAPPSAHVRRRVLIAGLSDALQSMVETVLQQWGHAVVDMDQVESGSDEEFDCVVLDGAEEETTRWDLISRLENRAIRWIILGGAPCASEGAREEVRRLQLPLLPSLLRKAIEEDTTFRSDSKEHASSRPFDGKEVLVAEDNPANQHIVRAMLERAGAVVTIVDDGGAAIEKVQSHRYDLVLMDYRMPKVDGIAATREIRQWERSVHGRERTRIIALTANAVAEEDNRFTAAGMDGYLMKPIEMEALHRLGDGWSGRCRESRPSARVMEDPADQGHLIDLAYLREVFGYDHDEVDAALAVLLDQFQRFREELVRIEQEAVSVDMSAGLGHKIAGCAYQMHNEPLAAAAVVLENATRPDQLPTARQVAGMIDDCIEQLQNVVASAQPNGTARSIEDSKGACN